MKKDFVNLPKLTEKFFAKKFCFVDCKNICEKKFAPEKKEFCKNIIFAEKGNVRVNECCHMDT